MPRTRQVSRTVVLASSPIPKTLLKMCHLLQGRTARFDAIPKPLRRGFAGRLGPRSNLLQKCYMAPAQPMLGVPLSASVGAHGGMHETRHSCRVRLCFGAVVWLSSCPAGAARNARNRGESQDRASCAGLPLAAASDIGGASAVPQRCGSPSASVLPLSRSPRSKACGTVGASKQGRPEAALGAGGAARLWPDDGA